MTAEVIVHRHAGGWHAKVGCYHDGLWVVQAAQHVTRAKAREWAKSRRAPIERAFAALLQGGE